MQLRHQLLQECLSCHLTVSFLILADNCSGGKQEATSTRVLESLIKGINAFFLIEGNNRDTSLEGSNLFYLLILMIT